MNALKRLEGKTIKTVKAVDYDLSGDDEQVGQRITVTCEDGEVFEFFADGGPGEGWYATVRSFEDAVDEAEDDE